MGHGFTASDYGAIERSLFVARDSSGLLLGTWDELPAALAGVGGISVARVSHLFDAETGEILTDTSARDHGGA